MQSAASAFRHTVKFTRFPSSGERVVLVIGRRGIALEPTTAYTMVHQRSRGLSPNTMMPQMRSVAMLLDWVDDQGIDLEQRLGSGDLLTNAEIYSLKAHLRDRLDGNGVVAGGQFRNRCVSVREYIAWHANMVISRIPNKDWQRAQAYRSGLERFVDLMSTGLPSPAERNREGHSEDIQEIFLEAIKPGSPNNPFKQKFQLRNYALLMLFHELGVRRAEPMKVMGEDLHLHGERPYVDFTFRNDDIVDPRLLEGRMKTQPRMLHVSKKLAGALRDWVKQRAKFGTAKKTPYVFVAGSGEPLGIGEVNRMFRLLRKRVPGLPADLTTHHKRHDANDRLSDLAKEQGWDDVTEERNRNYFFGWRKTSKQGSKYTARSTKEAAAKASLALQEKSQGGRK